MISDSVWFEQGSQTQITQRIRTCAQKISSVVLADSILRDDFTHLDHTLFEDSFKTCMYVDVFDYMEGIHVDSEGNVLPNIALKEIIFRKRTADDIAKEGLFPTCSDYAVLYRALLLAQGYPCSYVETFHKDFIRNPKNFRTHAFVKIYDANSYAYVDPTHKKIYASEKDLFPYIVYKEGLDSWDVGIRGFEDLFKARSQSLSSLQEKVLLLEEH